MRSCLPGIDQVEGGVLQHFGVHGQVFERRLDQAAHHRIGNAANAGLQRAELVGHTACIHFLLEEVDQVVGDALCFIIWRQHSGRRVRLVADDDTDDLGRIDRDRGAADTVVYLDQRDWRASRAVGWDIDVVQAFEVGVVREVDLHNHLLGEDREAGRVAHRSGWHDVALLGDGHGFDDRDVRQLQLLVAQLLDGFRQVLVNEHHLAVIDGFAQGAVDLERHAAGQHTGLGQLFVQVIAQAGAGHQADFQWRLLGTFGQCMRYGLGFSRRG